MRDRRWPFGAALLLFALAALIGTAVARGWVTAADRAGLLALGGAAAGHAAVPRAVTHLGDPPVRIALVVIVGLGLIVVRRWRDALFLASTVASGGLVITLLKADIARPRPTLLTHLDIVRNASFPSGHAANSALVYGTIALVLRETRAGKPLAILAVMIALMVGVSRIALAVHWPSDVLAGWAIGAAWLSLAAGLRAINPWRNSPG